MKTCINLWVLSLSSRPNRVLGTSCTNSFTLGAKSPWIGGCAECPMWSGSVIVANHHVMYGKISKYFICKKKYIYTGCPRRNVPNFGRVFLRLKYTDITQNTYIQS